MSSASHPQCRAHAFAKLLLDDGPSLNHAAVASHLQHLRNKYGVVKERLLSGAHSVAAQQTQLQQVTGGQKATIALVDESENLWHGAVTLGDYTVQVDFDTGSADLIVNKEAYAPGATAKDTGKTFSVQYSDLTKASGKIYADAVAIGGIKANGCTFGWAQTPFVDVSEGDAGIAGMAFASLSRIHATPFVATLINAGVLAEPMFTFALRDVKPTLTIGGLLDDVKGAPVFVNVDSSKGFWSTPATINGIAVNTIQDTGSGLIVAPVAVAKELFASLNLSTFTADNGTVYAHMSSPAPRVTMQFGAFSQTLSSDTLTSGTGGDGKPLLSIVGADVGVDAVVFGDPWFRNVAAVFSHKGVSVS